MMAGYTAAVVSHGPSHGPRSRGYRIAAWAALAYSLVIIYASLQPFTGWRAAALPPGAFLTAPWPRWITLEDIGFNFFAYLPLGFLLTIALCARLHPRSAVLLSAAGCALLSLTLETAQQFLPVRIASAVDLLVNACGGAAGALIAPLFAPGRRLGEELSQLRGQVFVEGARADAVLVLTGLWLLALLHTPPLGLGHGDLRASLGPGAPLFAYSPDSYRLAEATAVMLGLTALGLMLAGVARSPGGAFWRTLALIAAAAFTLKTAAALLIQRADMPWAWLTPGFAAGFTAAVLLLPLLAQLPRRGRIAVALLAQTAALLLVNSAPDNPYRNLPLLLPPAGSGHFLSFTSMLRALSDLWPYLAALLLLFSVAGRLPGDRR